MGKEFPFHPHHSKIKGIFLCDLNPTCTDRIAVSVPQSKFIHLFRDALKRVVIGCVKLKHPNDKRSITRVNLYCLLPGWLPAPPFPIFYSVLNFKTPSLPKFFLFKGAPTKWRSVPTALSSRIFQISI